MKKIFVAIDGSEHAWKALDYAAELAKGMNSTLFVYSALVKYRALMTWAIRFWLRQKTALTPPLRQNSNTRLAIRPK